jgi:YD repeat-containing protein
LFEKVKETIIMKKMLLAAATLLERKEWPMSAIALCVTILLALVTAASAQQTTIRDGSGRITGTVTTDSNGTKTFRDGSGRTTGTATRDSNGTTTFRDGSGRTTGTATAPRR